MYFICRRECISGNYNSRGSDIVESTSTCPDNQIYDLCSKVCVCREGYYNSTTVSGENECERCPLESETGMRCNEKGLHFKRVVVDRHYFKTIHDDGKGKFRVSGTLCPNRDACPTNTSGETTGMNDFDEINDTSLNHFLFCRVSYWLHRVLMCSLFRELCKFETSD